MQLKRQNVMIHSNTTLTHAHDVCALLCLFCVCVCLPVFCNLCTMSVPCCVFSACVLVCLCFVFVQGSFGLLGFRQAASYSTRCSYMNCSALMCDDHGQILPVIARGDSCPSIYNIDWFKILLAIYIYIIILLYISLYIYTRPAGRT